MYSPDVLGIAFSYESFLLMVFLVNDVELVEQDGMGERKQLFFRFMLFLLLLYDHLE